MKFKALSLRTTVLTFVLSIVLLGSVLTAGSLTYKAHQLQSAATQAHINTLADEQAAQLQARLTEGLHVARSLSSALVALKNTQHADRETANRIQRELLAATPSLLAVWTAWEPNAFDQRDAEFISQTTTGHDATGRYVPYWNRAGGPTQYTVEPLIDYDKPGPGDYYLLALKNSQETLLEPYLYKIAGKDTLITSIAVPIQWEGKTVGVAGIDIALSDLQAQVAALKPYDSGYASLVSHQGTYVADFDATQVGKPVAHLPDDVRTALQQGQPLLRTLEDARLHETVTQRWTPVKLGHTTTPWSLVVNVPHSHMLAGIKDLRNTAVVIGLGSLVLVSLALAIMLDRWVLRPLGGEPAKAAEIARTVAAGDLTRTIAVQPNDNTSLMSALHHMQRQLAQVVQGVRGNAEQVATAAGEIAQGNQDLSARTEQQASALQQTAASMDELGGTVRQNAQHARHAADLAVQASDIARRSGEVVGDVVRTMREIESGSHEISAIVGTIDAIAFQTNLLALNAAVEAARAGEEGRGFAVVANEVRMLSQRSADAAREIKALIGASVDRVERGTALVDDAGHTVQEVVQAIARVSTLIGEISTASDEQRCGVEQIGQAVSAMDVTTQQNAALVEQSMAASHSLSQQARGLVDSVSVFRV